LYKKKLVQESMTHSPVLEDCSTTTWFTVTTTMHRNHRRCAVMRAHLISCGTIFASERCSAIG